MHKRLFSALLLAALLFWLNAGALAAETQPEELGAPTEIYTVQDLMDLEKNPEGDYILMADLDMAGISWKPLDFSGTLDGNGHAILNLTLFQPGENMVKIADDEENIYDAAAFGLFGTLRGATIQNLTMINTRARVEWTDEATLGALAGYAENSTISDCLITGTLELRSGGWMSCLGGLVGYGSGTVRKCSIDVTLISVDTNIQSMGEEFLGGVYAAGFINVYNSNVAIDGYISEHGYIHSGGIAGMFAEAPLAVGQKGHIKGNSVSGQITFFEDNDDRLALCKPLLGMARVNKYYLDGNTEDFKIHESKDYELELRPEMCPEPVYSVRVAEPGCQRYGFTEYICDLCGYTFRDQYTCYAHTVIQWEVTIPATSEQEGQSVGKCECGLQFTRTDPKLSDLTPEESTEPTIPAPTRNESEKQEVPCEDAAFDLVFYGALVFLVLLLVGAFLVIRALMKRCKK